MANQCRRSRIAMHRAMCCLALLYVWRLQAMQDSTGLAAVHFVDRNCTALVGQYHPNDTAHDFAWGWPSLEAGQKFHARAALWITQLKGTRDQRMKKILARYKEWTAVRSAD